MTSVVKAVEQRDMAALDQALKSGGNPDAVDATGHSVLMMAAGSTQFRAANMLMDAGADIWFADKFGTTAEILTSVSNTKEGTEEDAARIRLIERFKAAGCPWPPPRPKQVLEMKAAGDWPPRSQATASATGG